MYSRTQHRFLHLEYIKTFLFQQINPSFGAHATPYSTLFVHPSKTDHHPSIHDSHLYHPGSFTVELKYFRSMPWYKAIFLSNFFNFILVLSTYFMVK